MTQLSKSRIAQLEATSHKTLPGLVRAWHIIQRAKLLKEDFPYAYGWRQALKIVETDIEKHIILAQQDEGTHDNPMDRGRHSEL